jgi:hypothetical protein
MLTAFAVFNNSDRERKMWRASNTYVRRERERESNILIIRCMTPEREQKEEKLAHKSEWHDHIINFPSHVCKSERRTEAEKEIISNDVAFGEGVKAASTLAS